MLPSCSKNYYTIIKQSLKKADFFNLITEQYVCDVEHVCSTATILANDCTSEPR